jgi:hypothetical protein
MEQKTIYKGGTTMATKDALNGAKTGFMFLDAYVNTVAQVIGMEKAIALMSKMCENMGAMQGKMIKQQSGIKEFNAKTAWELLTPSFEGIGSSFTVLEATPRRVAARFSSCPMYEAARTLGMDAKTIENACMAGPHKFTDTMAKQLNPNLSCRLLKFRSTPDDFCEEELVLG